MSNEKATMYDARTGEIVLSIEAPDKETILLQEIDKHTKIHWGEVWAHDKYYFVNGAPVPRPTMHLSESDNKAIARSEVLLVRGIPKGCEVTYPGGAGTVNDGFITWSTDFEGMYEFEFKLFPYVGVVLNVRVG